MAKKTKNKKKKSVSQKPSISIEKKIRDEARKLPIDKCYMRSEFTEGGIGSVIVTRKMGGHYIVGTYLIDKGCLGLKNTAYRYDIDEEDLEALVEGFSEYEDIEECSYVEAHNLIYGAIAYAEELGFKPEMDWKTSQYIVEEDSEEIELIEYEFGKNGQPFYVSGPFDNNAKVISTLNRSVGEGNYLSVFSMGGFDDDDEDYDYDDDEEEFWMSEEIQELAADIGFEQEDIDKFNFEIYSDPLVSEIKQSVSVVDLERIEYIATKAIHLQKANGRDIEELKAFIEKYPKYPQLYNYLSSAYLITQQIPRSEAIIDKTVELFPEYLYGKISYAERFFVANKPDEAIEKAFNGHLHLSDLYPNRDEFQINEFAAFHLAIIRYYGQKGDITKAEMYLDLIEEIAPNESHTINARKIFDTSQKKKGIFKLW
jgi:hypothetical protein